MKKYFLMGLILIGLAGCTAAPNQNRTQADNATPAPVAYDNRQVPQSVPERDLRQDPQATAKRLTAIAARVPGVKDATAIVFGKQAIVGIDVDDRLDRPRVGVIKYTVAEALKDDPQGANALVSADVGIVQRLREINADIQRGRPIAGFAEELSDIVGRLMPQATRDVPTPAEVENKRRPGDHKTADEAARTPGQVSP
jgi:YhcN/YlaJ family sporulation lipoprotein